MARQFTASNAGGTVKMIYKANKLTSILTGAKTQEVLRKSAEKIRARAASMYGAKDYGVKVIVGKNRAHAVVYTASVHAINSNALHNTLQKAARG